MTSDQEKFQKWALFPVIASSTETGLMLGGLAVRFFKPAAPDIRTNTVDFIAFGTMEEQCQIAVTPNLYFQDELYHLNLSVSGALWPANYYGIGNDTPEAAKEKYESRSISTHLILERRLGDGVYLGMSHDSNYTELETEKGGRLENSAGNSVQSGFGTVVTFDTRDNENDARAGSYLKFNSKWFRPQFGGDNAFEKYDAYARHYIVLAQKTGLALGGQIDLARGDIPFDQFNSPDGNLVLRGIENGRYRDRDMAAFQGEFRFSLAYKWGAVFFAEGAQVARNITEMTGDGWKYGVGGGIRYALNPAERFNLRLDLSYVDGGPGIVLNIREAF